MIQPCAGEVAGNLMTLATCPLILEMPKDTVVPNWVRLAVSVRYCKAVPTVGERSPEVKSHCPVTFASAGDNSPASKTQKEKTLAFRIHGFMRWQCSDTYSRFLFLASEIVAGLSPNRGSRCSISVSTMPIIFPRSPGPP